MPSSNSSSGVGQGFRPAVRCAAVAVLLLFLPVDLAAQMPDLRVMAGRAMPSGDLPAGTVSVRVVRENISNNLAGVEVELHGAGPVRRAETGSDGRARFDGIPPGSTVHAIALVDGERLTSSEFQVPDSGGVRTLLAAGLGGSKTAAPPSESESTEGPHSNVGQGFSPATAPGLRIGPNSRIVLEFSDDVLQAFYLLEIVNGGGAPVQLSSPLTIELPPFAEGATLLEGSTKQATVRGRQVSISGPFPAATTVHVAYRIDSFGDTLTLQQAFPLAMDMPITAVQKAGNMRLSSPQIARTQEMPVEQNTFIMGSGPALPAHTPLFLTITGLPYHSRTPVWLTLLLVAAIVAVGVWLAWSPPRAAGGHEDHERLRQDREERLGALAELETAHAEGRIDTARYHARQAALFAELERIYAALDDGSGDARRDVA